MTLLEIIRKKKVATATDATVATHNLQNKPTVANVASVAVANPNNEKINRDIEKVRSCLVQIGEPEENHYLILNKCKRDPEALVYYLGLAEESNRKKRRANVLKILKDNPSTQRAIHHDTETDPDNVILTIAIRDQYTFKMSIPKHKYDSFTVLEIIKEAAVQ
ncbi:hypothetical protein ABF87_04305 [Nitrosomonas sp. JL21]|uniref:hypothetical protein n=1 Tax=Nitrosomonas sp. JL21 TaxID=153949 RepID=UPI00136A7842|nr:hypothetical protein [Nitrosomonas sp. JL21]MBL8497326.1 hypothetical protein [Nitrosomonas sp.]MXS77195.1 hypothetical protein [Nitrosomonas sp. JL21]